MEVIPDGPKPRTAITFFVFGLLATLIAWYLRIERIAWLGWVAVAVYWGWYYGNYAGRWVVMKAWERDLKSKL